MPPELLLLAQICTKSFVGWGFAPDPTGGAYSATPDPLAGLRGPTSKEREGKGKEGEGSYFSGEERGGEGGEGRGEDGRQKEGEGERGRRKGMAGPIPNPLLQV